VLRALCVLPTQAPACRLQVQRMHAAATVSSCMLSSQVVVCWKKYQWRRVLAMQDKGLLCVCLRRLFPSVCMCTYPDGLCRKKAGPTRAVGVTAVPFWAALRLWCDQPARRDSLSHQCDVVGVCCCLTQEVLHSCCVLRPSGMPVRLCRLLHGPGGLPAASTVSYKASLGLPTCMPRLGCSLLCGAAGVWG
jgi:hypothetical protein